MPAWANEHGVLLCVDKILNPYLQTTPEHIVPLKFLDLHSMKICESICEKIIEASHEIKCIPASCTCIVQPVNIGIKKPIKFYAYQYLEYW